MGVTGLWTVVAPIARPTRLEQLNRKRLAVDASIWIYQFLKAVRDKEGNALRNSHVVGFFRRICKLLYFGIKPVFVFDGGAPVLKRETIRKRARRREGRRDDAARTAGKLLAVQVARAAEEESKRQRDTRNDDQEELPADQDLVYVEEIGMDRQQRQAGRTFKKKDQYHLPELDVSLEEMGAPNDPRVMSQTELEEYAKQFHSGEDINLYDFSKIDFDSAFFQSLPAGDKYNILNAARLRSRLRMGYSKEQLDGMFPDRMAFSRFQIERVKERNELTQRLMHISGMNEGDWDMGGRIAGERGKEYVLVHHEGVEGGWALGVVSNKGTKDNAIDVDADDVSETEKPPSEEEDEFEDVAIEGINRLPQTWKRKRPQTRDVDYDITYEEAAERIAKKRKAVYESRRKAAEERQRETLDNTAPQASVTQTSKPTVSNESDTLFVEQGNVTDSDEDAVFEDVTAIHHDQGEDDDLQRAIAMSLEKPENTEVHGGFLTDDITEDKQKSVINDDAFDLTAALAESRLSKYRPRSSARDSKPTTAPKVSFGGPLPFESLNLGRSLLGRKKKQSAEEGAGGFESSAGEQAFDKIREAQPAPDWFNTTADSRPARPGDMDVAYYPDNKISSKENQHENQNMKNQQRSNVINIDSDSDDEQQPVEQHTIDLDSELWDVVDEEEQNKLQDEADRKALEAAEVADARRKAEEADRDKRYELARQIAAENEVTMNDTAEEAQANPPAPSDISRFVPDDNKGMSPGSHDIEWSDSDHEMSSKPSEARLDAGVEPAGGRMLDTQNTRVLDNGDDDDDDNEFEDVQAPVQEEQPVLNKEQSSIDPSMFIDDDEAAENEQAVAVAANTVNEQERDLLEDDSDEELMRMLANEAEEHMRFANELNNTRPKSPSQAMRDYENELKQLRNQQKKDRRDADEVTQTMIQECQALLRLFGIPYITAPMEAEAQCAELVHLGLVDGIVTDDSDIFLFGGTRIYKNMFNAAKFVECYVASDLEKEYALDRRKLIRFAHLLGSDYTEGIPNIGPVTALDIVSDFKDLAEFKEWTLQVQLGSQTSSTMEGLLTTPFRRKFKRTAQRKLFLPTNFPDLRVDDAYLEPEVDNNEEEFQWGVPDLDKLRGFLMATIGWSQERTDEVLVPVIRDMNQRDIEGVQSNITKFFHGGAGVGVTPGRGIGGYNKPSGDVIEGTAPRNRTGKESGRMKNAYSRLRNEAAKKRRSGSDPAEPSETASLAEDVDSDLVDEGQADDEGGEAELRNKKRRAKSKFKSGRQ